MSVYTAVKNWFKQLWADLGATTAPTKKQDPVIKEYLGRLASLDYTGPKEEPVWAPYKHSGAVVNKEKPVPVSPASVSTGASLPNTTATFYGAKKPKKSVKKPSAKKTKKK